jgi:NAD dependent epimerase/dehydratase
MPEAPERIESLRDRRVLVTGADGFIGSHLVERLVREGASVRALVYYNAFDSQGWLDTCAGDVRRAIEVLPGDVRDAERTGQAVRGCSVVFHLAALIGIPYSYAAPRSYYDTNVLGTLNVLEAARQHAVARTIQTSTSEVYGTARYVPIDEEHPLGPQSPYAASKVAADQLALSYHRSFGLPVTIVRPFNTYGPRQSLRAVIPSIVVQLLRGRGPVRLGSVEPTRDFNFVDDVVSGFVAAAVSPRAVGQVINLGTGYEVSIRQTAEQIAEILGRSLTIENDAERLRPAASEVERLCASAVKARELVGWAPAHEGAEGLRRGLTAAIAWFQRPENLAHYREREYSV